MRLTECVECTGLRHCACWWWWCWFGGGRGDAVTRGEEYDFFHHPRICRGMRGEHSIEVSPACYSPSLVSLPAAKRRSARSRNFSHRFRLQYRRNFSDFSGLPRCAWDRLQFFRGRAESSTDFPARSDGRRGAMRRSDGALRLQGWDRDAELEMCGLGGKVVSFYSLS